MRFEEAKSIVRPVKNIDNFFPVDFNMNIYRGCSHGCIYCDSRSICYRLDNFGEVRGKADSTAIIREELKRRKKTGIIGTGAMSDPYNPQEAEYCLTGQALDLIGQYGFGAGITTKSDLVARDADRLREINTFAPAYVTFSVTAADDALSVAIEPGAPATSNRLEAMNKLTQAKVWCGVWLNPVLPFITDGEDNLRRIVKMSHEAGARYVVCHFGVTMREGNREYFYEALERKFPRLKEKYQRTFGSSYICKAPEYRRLKRMFKELCSKYGLMTDFREINLRIRQSVEPVQYSLFD